jgi:hypothetical protein
MIITLATLQNGPQKANEWEGKKIEQLEPSFVDYGLVKKFLGARCTFEEVAEKTKCQKMNVNILQPN